MKYIYKYRYALAAVLFVLCVVFEFSGSSIGAWKKYLGGSGEEGAENDLLGTYREIRSDEWALNTPMAFSQYYNREGEFPYFSSTLRGTDTDAFIVYGQPVKSWEVIFRPFHWGYLFLPPAKGLSFFWCGRLLALLLVSFEFGMYLFHKRKSYAAVYALLLGFSPAVQWWFAINGLVEMLVMGQLALLIGIAYLRTDSCKKRFCLVFPLVLCMGGYILTFYPSWQIPLGYVYLALLIGIVIRESRPEMLAWKKDLPLLALFLALLGVSMGSIFRKSWDTVQAVMNTAYPGNRSFHGGDALKILLNWAGNLVFPYRVPDLGTTNICEGTSMFSFFPLGILAALWVLIKERKKDPMLISLLTGSAVMSLYCIVPWPSWLAKLTLFSMSQSERTVLGAGLFNLLLFLYAAEISEKKIETKGCLVLAGVLAVLSVGWLSRQYQNLYAGMAAPFIFLAFFLGFAIGMNALGKKGCKFLAIYSMIIAVAGGMTVNPLHSGADDVLEDPVTQAIRQTVQEDEENGLWIVEDMGNPYINLPIVTGAPTINCTNTYPAMERWEKLDTDGKRRDVYNRYAHIQIVLSRKKWTTFSNPTVDSMLVKLAAKDLETLEVKHIFTDRTLEKYETEGISFRIREQVGKFYIYDVVYE